MQNDLEILCLKVCIEFDQLGFKKDIDPRTLKESYSILKQPNGLWLKITKSGLHDSPIQSSIDFEKMPFLKELIDLIEELDPEVQKKGGRIFITETLVLKMKKGTEIPILYIKNKGEAKNQKLCEEMLAHGLERDRYRTEETYMLSKTANGEWSMTTSHENHSGAKIILNLGNMPLLKNLATKLARLDPQFQSNGGRIFITPTRIYRLKNKVELDFKL
jgi:hypothetical protein